ncbi:MAG: UxaA family hydrolase [Suipraeoptans sp.]
MKKFIQIHQDDNVAVALTTLNAHEVYDVSGKKLALRMDIPQGHKFAISPINKGDNVVKYGNPIGYAAEDINAGDWVHTHNIKTTLGDLLTYTYNPNLSPIPSTKEAFFNGYRRANGKVGVRNEIWIIPTVGCVNNVASSIEKQSRALVSNEIDDIVAFPHPYGCSQMGEDQENTRRILVDLVNHPNAAGVLVLGLGCENSGIEVLKKYIGEYDDKRVKFLVAQDSSDEILDSLNLIEELVDYANTFKREKISVSELVIGMKCGGSDGLSGITANPAVGAFSDLLISKGGSTILTEVPEMFGAETLLMNRAKNEETFNKTVTLVNDFKDYFKSHNQTIYENPSPGNKQGGISTLEDKSLGCTQKSGSAVVNGVLAYGEPIKEHGLNLLSAPGNDLVASTALAASGAHIVLFTTGRGTPFASPVPTVKISTNSTLYNNKSNWIDFNCGVLVEGTTMDDLKQQLFDFCIDVANGKQVKSELAGYHDMAIFKKGVTL